MTRLAAIMVVAAVCGMVGTSFGEPTKTSIEVYSDGLAYVISKFDADPQEPSFHVGLLGTVVDNFMAVNRDGELLASRQDGVGSMSLETFGSGQVVVSYDVHDIVSKQGRIWTFVLDVGHGYTLQMPANSVIVGMNVIPIAVNTINDRMVLEMPGEPAQIRYITNTQHNVEPIVPVVPATPDGSQEMIDVNTILLVVAPLAVVVVGALAVMRIRARRTVGKHVSDTPLETPGPDASYLDPDAIFAKIPHLREEDRMIVRYICQNGGEITESSLRKKFLRPKTTMWRSVQRLRREGVVDIIKKDLHNHVVIRHLEDEG